MPDPSEEQKQSIRDWLKSVGNPYSPDDYPAASVAWAEGYNAAMREAQRMLANKQFGREKNV